MSQSSRARATAGARAMSRKGRNAERRIARAVKRQGIALAERAYVSLLAEREGSSK